jgi:hypothetical protein
MVLYKCEVGWLDQNYNMLIAIYHNHTERHIMKPHYVVTRTHNPYFIYNEVIIRKKCNLRSEHKNKTKIKT